MNDPGVKFWSDRTTDMAAESSSMIDWSAGAVELHAVSEIHTKKAKIVDLLIVIDFMLILMGPVLGARISQIGAGIFKRPSHLNALNKALFS